MHMNTTRTHQSLIAATIVALALTGCATSQASEPNPVPAPQQAPSAPLDRAGAFLKSDNDPRGYHGTASISGATGMPTAASESPSTVPAPTPRVNDNDPRGHHDLPAIEGADGFGVPTAPQVSDDDPRGYHPMPNTRR